MRKSRYQMKRFAVMILSACLVLQQGAVSTLAAETGPGTAEEAAAEADFKIEAVAAETASASDAVPAETASAAAKDAEQTTSVAAENAGSAAEEATSSNAMFDEEGSLLDGGVIQDVPVEAEEELLPEAELIDEIIPAPETKTEILDPQRATIWSWLDDYEYTLDLENHCVTLEKYNGTDTELVIPGEEQFGSEYYQVVIGPAGHLQSIWYQVSDTLKSLVLEDGVKLPGNSSYLFSALTALEHLDLSGVDTSSVGNMSYMFYDCESLTELDLSSFDTSAVNSMGNMFAYCMALKHVDVSSFDTSQVTDVYCMFRNCESLTDLDLSSFDLSRITKYDGMFFCLYELQTLHTPYNNKAELDIFAGMYDKTGQRYTSVPAGTKQSLFLTDEPSYISVTGIKINTSQRTIVPGKTFQLAAWPQPTDATYRGVTWTSSDSSVASVNSSGLVTAVRDGTATITAKTVDGGFTAACVITVGIPVTSVKINAAEKVVAPGKTFQLAAWPQPANAANKAVTWTSSNPSVAKVSSSGLVTAVSEGTATITVKTVDGGKTATCAITVGVPVTSVKINSTSKLIAPGATFQLAAWPQPTNAANRKVTWSSSNPAVATVSSTGLVKAVSLGSATITVKTVDGGKTATCAITVKVPVTSVKINTTAKTIAPGATFQLAAWPQPTNATNKAVTWSSSNTAVATVSSTGKVTAVKAGTATITVKTVDGGKTATCKITVKISVTGVNINAAAKTMDPGATFQLKAWPQPSTATNKNVTWSSSDTSVATVSSTGLVKAVKSGAATITVKTADGGKTATCKITVKIPVTGLKINAASRTIARGNAFVLTAWPQPVNATNKAVTFTSSNPAVAKVSSEGLVQAVSKGTAIITVKTVDGGFTQTCKITVN